MTPPNRSDRRIRSTPEWPIATRETGSTTFTVPELAFDLFYPGQYRRRVRSARLTIPCVAGPYTNVSATMSLVDSRMRVRPDVADAALELVPATRSTLVAASSGQNDAGVFRLDFRDERYMPFEGAGAVESTWRIELPRSFRPFDYGTITDVVLHLSYTAEYDGAFRDAVEGANARVESALRTTLTSGSLRRALSLRQEFSTAYHRLTHGAVGAPVSLELTAQHFPLLVSGRPLAVSRAVLVLGIHQDRLRDASGALPPNGVELRVERGGRTVDLTAFTENPSMGGLLTAELGGPLFGGFDPTSGETLTLTVIDPGILAPSGSSEAIDTTRLRDATLYLEYGLA